MIRAAVEGAGSGCQILAVTILTSLDSDAVSVVWGRSAPVVVEDEVLRLAAVAQAGGAHGVVCSGREVASIHHRFGGEVASLVPGLRFADGDVHDQARVVTPGAAVSAGARYLVLGRAVSGAADPGAAMARVWSEIETASR